MDLNSLLNPVEKIGQGGFGEVYKCIQKETINQKKQIYAVKSIPNDKLTGLQCLNEAYYMTILNHQNLIKATHIRATRKNIYIVMPLADCDLQQMTKPEKGGTPLTGDKAVNIIYQICKAVEFLHKQKIIHADIKSSNILIFGDTAKLSDFSLMNKIFDEKEKQSGTITTVTHRAPEIILKKTWDQQIDIWSLGCTIHEMLTGYTFMPFQGAALPRYSPIERERLGRALTINALVDWAENYPFGIRVLCPKVRITIKHKPVRFMLKTTDPLGALVARMLDPDPETRITIDEILSHEIFIDKKKDSPNTSFTECVSYKTSGLTTQFDSLIEDQPLDPVVVQIAKNIFEKIKSKDSNLFIACLNIANKIVKRKSINLNLIDRKLLCDLEMSISNDLKFNFF